jgi:hypothetical protein
MNITATVDKEFIKFAYIIYEKERTTFNSKKGRATYSVYFATRKLLQNVLNSLFLELRVILLYSCG